MVVEMHPCKVPEEGLLQTETLTLCDQLHSKPSVSFIFHIYIFLCFTISEQSPLCVPLRERCNVKQLIGAFQFAVFM